jgi:hypothetical protein
MIKDNNVLLPTAVLVEVCLSHHLHFLWDVFALLLARSPGLFWLKPPLDREVGQVVPDSSEEGIRVVEQADLVAEKAPLEISQFGPERDQLGQTLEMSSHSAGGVARRCRRMVEQRISEEETFPAEAVWLAAFVKNG